MNEPKPGMSIQEALDRKREVEKHIARLLLEFSEQTRLDVYGVDVQRYEETNHRGREFRYIVQVDARLK